MPLTRYLIRNEYGLADPEVYRGVEKDDPEALLEGIAMAGLIGILRQLGDLAEFAAELFHDLHEEIMATSARGHGLVIRVRQLEAELPSVERTLLTRTNHLNFAYSAGTDWRSNLRVEHNLVTRGDLPRFVMDSYEECRAPPQLFMLDRFDVAGAGTCLKRYSDPSFFRMELSTSGSLEANAVQSEKRSRRVKKGLRLRNGETLQALLNSQMDDASLIAHATNAKAEKIPRRGVKLKIRQMNGYASSKKKLGRTYMEQILETPTTEANKILSMHTFSTVNPLNDATYISEIHDKSGQGAPGVLLHTEGAKAPSPKKLKDVLTLPSSEPVHDLAVTVSRKSAEVAINDVEQDHIFVDGGNKVEMSAKGDFASALETYMDALATIESELETDSPCRTKNEVELFAMDLQDADSDINGDQLQQPSESYDFHVKNSPASYGSSVSFRKEKLQFSSTNAANGLPDMRFSGEAYISLDSEDMIELKSVNPAPCDAPHLETIDGAHSSSVDDALVTAFTGGSSSSIEEMHSTISIMLPESSEQNSADSSFPNTVGEVSDISGETSYTFPILGAGELPRQKEGSGINEVQALENGEHYKSTNPDMILEVCVEGASSTQMSEVSSASLLEEASTFPCPHKECPVDEVQPAYTMSLESNAENKSGCPLICHVVAEVHFEASGCSQMSGEASCAPSVPCVASNVSCPSNLSSMDEAETAAAYFLPDSSGQDKHVDSPVSSVTNGVYCDGSNSNGASGVSYASSILYTAPITPFSLEVSTVARTSSVPVMFPGGSGEYKSLECDTSDVTTQDRLGYASLLQEPRELSCASSRSEATSALPCTHEGTVSDLVQISLSKDNETFLNCDSGFVPDPPRVVVTDEGENSMSGFHHQTYAADTSDKMPTQYHDNVISANRFTSGSSNSSLLMNKEETEQCEADISMSKDIFSSLTSIDLCSHHDLGTKTQNSAPCDENLKVLPAFTVVEGQTSLESESPKTIATFSLPLSVQSNAGEQTPLVPQEDCDIKESAEADVLSPRVPNILTENDKQVLNRLSNEASEGQNIGGVQLYSLVRNESASGDFPSTVVVNEMENISVEHRESESLDVPSVSNGNLDYFKLEPVPTIMEGFPNYVDIEPVSVVTRTVEPDGEIEDKHISDETLSPKSMELKVSPPRETTCDSMLLNVALEATPPSDLSRLCSSDYDRVEESDGAREILCDNARLDLEGDRDPCQAVVDQQPDALPEPDSVHECNSSNRSASHEPFPLVVPERMYTDIGSGSHDSRPGKDVLDSEEISSCGATLQDTASGLIPYQQNSDIFRSALSSHDKSDPETSELGPETILLSSEALEHNKIAPDLPSYHEYVQYPSTCVSAQEYPYDVLDGSLSNDYTESVVQSISSASKKETNLDQHELHTEQVSMIPAVVVTASHELQEYFTSVDHCNQRQELFDISEECSSSTQSDGLDSIEIKNSNKTMDFGHHYGLPENERENTVSIPAPVCQTDLYLAQKSSVQSADVMPSLYTDARSSTFEVERMENLRESGSTNCHNTYRGYTGSSRSPSAAGIASLAEPSHEFVEAPEPSQTKQNATSISVSAFPLSDVSPMTSSAFYSGFALFQPETDHAEKHYLGQIDPTANSSNPPVLPDVGYMPEWMPLLPLPPMEWIMGKPRPSFFLLPGEASHQPIITPDITMTEAAHSNGTLPWKRRSLYKRSKDPLIEAVASHDKSRLRKVSEQDRTDSKPKPDEAVASHDKSRLRKVTERDHVEIKPKPDEAVLSHDKSRLRKVTEQDTIDIKPKPDERDVLLEQIRAKSFNLKPTAAPRPAIHVPTTNIKVAAILEKAKAIRQAHAGTGSDNDDDADKWSDA